MKKSERPLVKPRQYFQGCILYPVIVNKTIHGFFTAKLPDFPDVMFYESETKTSLVQSIKSFLVEEMLRRFRHELPMPRPSTSLITNENYEIVRLFFKAQWNG